MGTILFFFNKYIISDEGLATLLSILAITLKLSVNREVTKLHFKQMIVSIPSEITILAIGFLLSAMVRENATDETRVILTKIVIALIIIIIQYGLERYLDNKLSGKIRRGYMLLIIIMYFMSIFIYYLAVFGGNN